MDLKTFSFMNPPETYELTDTTLFLTTDPETDFWQKTCYGATALNGHAFLAENNGDFTFTVKASYTSEVLYDQCGVMVYIDGDNWMKGSIEFDGADCSKLGSVVTRNGFSDWATTDIPFVPVKWYRLSKRRSDFLLEQSDDGETFRQMRIFHLDTEGKTVRFGLYACSPMETSFTAAFTDFKLEDCLWEE